MDSSFRLFLVDLLSGTCWHHYQTLQEQLALMLPEAVCCWVMFSFLFSVFFLSVFASQGIALHSLIYHIQIHKIININYVFMYTHFEII